MNIIQALTILRDMREPVEGRRLSFNTLAYEMKQKTAQTVRRWVVGECFPLKAFHSKIIKVAKKIESDPDTYRTPTKSRTI